MGVRWDLLLAARGVPPCCPSGLASAVFFFVVVLLAGRGRGTDPSATISAIATDGCGDDHRGCPELRPHAGPVGPAAVHACGSAAPGTVTRLLAHRVWAGLLLPTLLQAAAAGRTVRLLPGSRSRAVGLRGACAAVGLGAGCVLGGSRRPELLADGPAVIRSPRGWFGSAGAALGGPKSALLRGLVRGGGGGWS